MFSRDVIKGELFSRYIKPTEKNEKRFIGIEIEMPVVRLNGLPTDFESVQKAVNNAFEHFNFVVDKIDDNGVSFSATRDDNGDNISFDCAYNNLEISMGRALNLYEIHERFNTYVKYINELLSKTGHILTGMGINPNYKINRKDFIPYNRYRMLEHYLKKSSEWNVPMYFHNYSAFGAFASASQVQLDVNKEKLAEVIKVFSLIEPVKSVIFNNSVMEEEPDLLCVRDLFWENSTHGINPHNIGAFDCELDDIDDLLEYIMTTSIFCAERDGKYLFFKPVPIIDYFNLESVTGEYYEDNQYTEMTFKPDISDLNYLRTYKFEDLTFRGTIEFRSVCCQPLKEVMTVAAFHVGLMNSIDELSEIISNDKVLYHHGYSCTELRKIMNRKEWPEFVDREKLSKLCSDIVNLAYKGLVKRGMNEEVFIEPLIKRADSLMSPGRLYLQKIDEGKSIDELIKEYSL